MHFGMKQPQRNGFPYLLDERLDTWELYSETARGIHHCSRCHIPIKNDGRNGVDWGWWDGWALCIPCARREGHWPCEPHPDAVEGVQDPTL